MNEIVERMKTRRANIHNAHLAFARQNEIVLADMLVDLAELIAGQSEDLDNLIKNMKFHDKFAG